MYYRDELQSDSPFDINDIVSAIELEMNATPRAIEFKIEAVKSLAGICEIDLEETTKSKLEESFEDAKCRWRYKAIDSLGKETVETVDAEIVTVILEKNKIGIANFSGNVPKAGDTLTIYPPQYLEKLKDLWKITSLSSKFLKKYDNTKTTVFDEKAVLGTINYPLLRERQKEAFKLTGYSSSFLWGPPGTGKTYTLGAMLAQHVVQFSHKKVLLVSSTNTAVDQALLAVDKALSNIEGKIKNSSYKNMCKRVGKHYKAEIFKDKGYLLPGINSDFLNDLIELEKQKPGKESMVEYALWKRKMKILKDKIKVTLSKIISESSLVATTITFVIFFYEVFEDSGFDLVVFDEVSQSSIAHTLPVACLGRKVLYAGDYKQLAPIVKSKNKIAKEWLNKTVFDIRDIKKMPFFTFLNEQSRMTDMICQIVSRSFYDNMLAVSKDAEGNHQWLQERQLVSMEKYNDEPVIFIKVEEKSFWTSSGIIRLSSANEIASLAQELVMKGTSQKDILILTPFHSQRISITRELKKKMLKHIDVSTVHKSQGSERHTIIIDPVMADSDFFQNDEKMFEQLLNVAISRAKARVIFLYHDDDLDNKTVQKLFFVYDQIRNPFKQYSPIQDYFNNGMLLESVIGSNVSYLDFKLHITGISDSKLHAIDCSSGNRVKFSIPEIVKISRNW